MIESTTRMQTIDDPHAESLKDLELSIVEEVDPTSQIQVMVSVKIPTAVTDATAVPDGIVLPE